MDEHRSENLRGRKSESEREREIARSGHVLKLQRCRHKKNIARNVDSTKYTNSAGPRNAYSDSSITTKNNILRAVVHKGGLTLIRGVRHHTSTRINDDEECNVRVRSPVGTKAQAELVRRSTQPLKLSVDSTRRDSGESESF